MTASFRVIHIGDLHLGPNERQADRLAALDAIIAAEEARLSEERLEPIGLWALPGDLFHRNSTIEDRNAIAPRLQRLTDIAPVLIVRGNHDAPGDLDILEKLAGIHSITLATRPRVAGVMLPGGQMAAVACIPYPDRAGLVSAGVDSALVEDEGSHALEVMTIALAAGLTEAAATGAAPMVFGHINVAGARASSGQPQIGRELELSQAALAPFPAGAYVGLNHIHKHQVIGRAVYAGSICRLDYGEVEPKGYIEVTYTHGPSGWAHTWVMRPLPVAPLYHVEGELTREGFTFVCMTGVGGETVPTPDSWRGCEVRVRYRFQKAELGALDVAQIHATFAEAKSLKLDPVPMLAQNVRAPEIATAPTLEAKVQTCCEMQGVTWTAGIAAKLAALQTQDPAVLLAGVTGAAAPVAAPAQRELAEVTR